MGEVTAISWTDKTFNPWWGCTKVSPACDNCYAEAWAKRTGHQVWGQDADRRLFGDKHWDEPRKWDRQAAATDRPALVFCASMADVFEPREELDEERARLWSLIDDTPHLIWQLLTKRPEQVNRMVPPGWLDAWPHNVWMGTTVEDQRRAELRVPRLQNVPASVRFLSCEPLLGPVDLRPWLRRINDDARAASQFTWDTSHRIGWVIVGGESGSGHRPLDPEHAMAIRDECQRWGVPFFFKQWGGLHPSSGGDLLEQRSWHQFPPEARRG